MLNFGKLRGNDESLKHVYAENYESKHENLKKNLKLETKSPPPAFLALNARMDTILAFNAQLLAIMGV